MILQFDVINQKIVRRDDNYIVANSQFYLQMDFNFTQDWYGFGKTITFVGNAKKYSIGLNSEDSCIVPYDVIKTPSFSFSIRGELNDVVITTNVMTISIKPSGETQGVSPSDPPKEIFSGLQNGLKGQVLGKVTDDNYDYEFQNLKDLQYDDENTLEQKLNNLSVDAVEDIIYEERKLKKLKDDIITDIVELYNKEEIDNLLNQYIEKSDTQGLIKNDGTIDTTEYASQSNLENEKNARINAISDEARARENADTQLQTAINNVARTYQNTEVDINNFTDSLEYEEYPYEAIIIQDDNLINKNIKGMTLTFSLNESSSGNYASVFKVDELTGEIIIYAKEIPEENFIIPNIVIIF